MTRAAGVFPPCVAVLWLLAAAAPAPALDSTYQLGQYHAAHWGEDEGLPQNSVHAMVQTRDGYLWLGTQEGLARFDGVRFTVFDSATVPELATNHVSVLFEEPELGLWVGTFGGGLLRYAEGRFIRYGQRQGLADAAITSLAAGEGGGLWVGTEHGLYRLAGERFTPVSITGRPGGESVNALLRDRRGRLWCATHAGLAVRAANGDWRLFTTTDGLPDDRVHALAEDAGGIWVGTAHGLARLADGPRGRFEPAVEVRARAVLTLLMDRHDGLWVGTVDGLQRLRIAAGGAPIPDRGAYAAPVVSLLEDREGSLWVGTDGAGLTRLREGAAVTYGAAQGLADPQVYAIAGDAGGGLWAGTLSGAVWRLEEGRFTAIPSRDVLRNGVARCLLVARDGALWIGGDHALARWDGERFTTLGHTQGLPPFAVRALAEDAAGTLWVGTDGGGVARFRGGRFEALTARDGLAGNQVRALLPARGGGLWIGTYGGLSLLRGGRFTSYTTQQGLPSRLVRSLHEDRDGTLWIGTYGGGLARLRDGRVTSYRRRDGLLSDVIYQILDDGRGRLWLSCNLGVFRLDRRELEAFADGRLDRLTSRSYGKDDGMASRECNGGSPGGWRTPDGRLWFPTVAGLVTFDTAREKRNEVPPAVVIEDALVDGRRLRPEDGMELPPGTRRVELAFAALSLAASARNRLRYRLEGYDDDWLEAGPGRNAVYTQLPPGAYRLRVIAANSDGVWNRDGASLAFRVHPYFHETPFFYALCAAAAVLAAFGVYWLRTRRLRARERELRRRVEEALARLKVLSGLLPICASCKKIRDDGGYWQQLEGYIHDHSEAEFSHGICPDCARRLYPGIELPGEQAGRAS